MQDFKLGGHTLKNGAERREARTLLGYFVWKITILRQKIINTLHTILWWLPLCTSPTKLYFQGFFRHLYRAEFRPHFQWKLPCFIPNLLLWIPNSWINSNFVFEFRLKSFSSRWRVILAKSGTYKHKI
jgi:hypothetical protein